MRLFQLITSTLADVPEIENVFFANNFRILEMQKN